MSYTLHTIDNKALHAVEAKYGVKFIKNRDSYREWCEAPVEGDPLHATLDLNTIEQAVQIAGDLHLAELPTDLSASRDWSVAVSLPPFDKDNNHLCYSDLYPR